MVAPMRTHYDVLGVDDCASASDIKVAFRRMALVWHPDRCEQPGATDKFMELKAAYDTLVDLASRAEYDLQLNQAAQPPPLPAGPRTVGYDWAKYRSTNMRRSRRSRTFRRKVPFPQQEGPAAASPRPTARAPYGDDFDALFPSRVAGGASGAEGKSHPPDDASRAASTSGQTASMQQTYKAAAACGSARANGIFTDNTASASASTAFHSQSNSSSGASSTSTSSSGCSNFGGNSVINRMPYANQQTARATSAFWRSSNRNCSRLRYSQAASSSTGGPSRAPSHPLDQQWHSTFCSCGEGSVSAAGASYAATTAAVCAAACATGRGEGASSSSGAAAAWDAWIAGDGCASAAAAVPVAEVGASPEPEGPVPAWRGLANTDAGGGDQAQDLRADVRVEQTEVPPVRSRAAPTAETCFSGPMWNLWPLMWEVVVSMVPVRM